MRRTLLALAAAAPLIAHPLHAQFGPPPSGFVVENPVLRRMYTLGMDSSQVERFAQVLLDSIGPRLTGAPGMDNAQNWLVQTYQRMGVTAQRERYGTWRGWRRGVAHVDLVAPRVRTLEATMLAFSPGTGNRPVRAPVVALPDLPDSAAFAGWLPQARGKFVLISFPEPTCRPDSSWITHDSRAIWERFNTQRTDARRAWAERVRRTGFGGGLAGANLSRRLDSAGVAGVLTSTWATGWGTNRVFSTLNARSPGIDVSCEDYGLLYRLAANNQGPVIEVTADAQAMGEVPVFNVIAEIRGTTLPNEYVVLSAHLDSWDGGSGATDNGTGTITMLEAMRILRQAYPSPKRTIIVGHWAAEEYGLMGSRAYAHDHPEVVNGMQALFNQDNGTGRIMNVGASGLVGANSSLASWLGILPADLTRDIRYGFTGSPGSGGTDHASFICFGAPAFGLGSEPYDYFTYTWHTTRDTYDKLSFDDLRQNATLTAMLTYLAADDTTRVSRERRTVFNRMPNGQTATWPACEDAPRSSAGSTR